MKTKFFSALVLIALITFTLTMTACKTTEEVRREKQLESSIHDSQNLMAEMTKKINDLEALVAKNSGAVEEVKYQSGTSEKKSGDDLKLLTKQVAELFAMVDEQKQELGLLKTSDEQQKKYLETLLATLTKLQDSLSKGSSTTPKKKKKTKSSENKDE
ncbi:MAG: hypothetical protein HQK50_00030 [Oligoflexia bacterium]|nr:hypothetical protein [Oligoflexia bacterium]MBF0363921.1 hypothetical protein [Oligoflexia bacterium]